MCFRAGRPISQVKHISPACLEDSIVGNRKAPIQILGDKSFGQAQIAPGDFHRSLYLAMSCFEWIDASLFNKFINRHPGYLLRLTFLHL